MQTAWVRMRRPVTRRLIRIQAVWHPDNIFTNFLKSLKYFEHWSRRDIKQTIIYLAKRVKYASLFLGAGKWKGFIMFPETFLVTFYFMYLKMLFSIHFFFVFEQYTLTEKFWNCIRFIRYNYGILISQI